jgi:hypothetical protein
LNKSRNTTITTNTTTATTTTAAAGSAATLRAAANNIALATHETILEDKINRKKRKPEVVNQVVTHY